MEKWNQREEYFAGFIVRKMAYATSQQGVASLINVKITHQSQVMETGNPCLHLKTKAFLHFWHSE